MHGPPRIRPARLGLSSLGLVLACALAGTAATAQTPGDYTLPAPAAGPAPLEAAAPAVGRSVVIRRISGRVTYRPDGSPRSRRLASRPVALRFGARVDATRGRVAVTIARNHSGGTSTAHFYSGTFRLSGQEAEAPHVATLALAGTSFAQACGDAQAQPAAARSAARRRSSRRVRRLWGSGKGRFRTRGRYSAATVRGTIWLTEDRCDGTLTRVRRGEVIVEDFTADEPMSEGTPAPPHPPPPQDGGQVGGQAPSASPAPMRAPRRKQVRVRRGGSYTASPKS